MTIIFSSKDYSIYKIAPDRFDPALLSRSPDFLSFSRTASEISIIAETNSIPGADQEERGWQLLYIDAVISFAACGILASILQPLAMHRVNVLAISTFDTDYVLFRKERRSEVTQLLASWSLENVCAGTHSISSRE